MRLWATRRWRVLCRPRMRACCGAPMRDHDRDFAAFYNHLADLLE